MTGTPPFTPFILQLCSGLCSIILRMPEDFCGCQATCWGAIQLGIFRMQNPAANAIATLNSLKARPFIGPW